MIIVILKVVVITQLGDMIEQKVTIPGIPFPLNASPQMWDAIGKLIGGIPHQRSDDESLFVFRRDVMKGHDPDKFLARLVLGMMNWNQPTTTTTATTTIKEGAAERGVVEARQYGGDPAQQVIFFLYSATPESAQFVGSLGGDYLTHHKGDQSGMLGRIQTKDVRLYNRTSLSVPYFLSRPDFESMRSEVFADFNQLNNMTMYDVKYNTKAELLTPDAFVAFYAANASQLNYSFAVNDFYLTDYHRKNNFTRFHLNICVFCFFHCFFLY
jgi:hypothetical protein